MVNDYVALDLETTGLEPKRDRIIEFGGVRVRNGVIVEQLKLLIQPGVNLPEKVIELTGITPMDLKNAPFLDEKLDEILKFIGEDCLLGHSILFDYSFLKRAAVNAGQSFERNAIDTLSISRIHLAELPSRNLHQLCLHYEIGHVEHRALEDAIATHELYQCLCREFEKKALGKEFVPKPLCYQVKREGPITKAQKERLYRMRTMHKMSTEVVIERMTKNEASRMIDQIIAQYGRD